MARIVIADGEFIARKGLRQIVSETSGLEVAGEAGTPEELLTLLRSQPFDLIVLELTLGSTSGIDVLKRVRNEFPELPVLVFSRHDERFFAISALRAGASGYFQKSDPPGGLIEAIRRVLSGGRYLSERMSEKIAADLAHSGANLLPHERLSDREFEVFRMLGGGRSVSEIARALHLSVKTVSTHRTRILEKTGLIDNADIVRYVTSHQLT